MTTPEITRIRAALEADASPDVAMILMREELSTVLEFIDQQAAEIESLKRGEYICLKCCLRKDADSVPVDF